MHDDDAQQQLLLFQQQQVHRKNGGGNDNGTSSNSRRCRTSRARARTILAAVIVANIALLLGFQFHVLLGASKAVVTPRITEQKRGGGGYSAVPTSTGASPSTSATSRGGTGVEADVTGSGSIGDGVATDTADATSDGAGGGASIVPNTTTTPMTTTTPTTTLSYHQWEIESISSLRWDVGPDDDDKNTSVVVEEGRCIPPIGGASRSFCCLGSTSRGGGSKYHPHSAECALGHTDAYERVRLAAEGELNRSPSGCGDLPPAMPPATATATAPGRRRRHPKSVTPVG